MTEFEFHIHTGPALEMRKFDHYNHVCVRDLQIKIPYVTNYFTYVCMDVEVFAKQFRNLFLSFCIFVMHCIIKNNAMYLFDDVIIKLHVEGIIFYFHGQ